MLWATYFYWWKYRRERKRFGASVAETGEDMLVPNATFVVTIAATLMVALSVWGSALIDVGRRSPSELRALGGMSRGAWLTAIVVAGPVGGLTYWLYSRIRLRR